MTTAASQETAGWVRADSGRQVDGPPHTRALEHAPTLAHPNVVDDKARDMTPPGLLRKVEDREH
jgi:hypothetical protein